MANAQMMSHTGGAPTRGGTGASTSQTRGKAVAAVPFVRASVEHCEPTGYDVTTAMTTSVQTLSDIVVPAYGFLRAIRLVVTVTGGVGTGISNAPDAPFNVLQNLILQEPNGAQICNFPSGYDCFLANKYGGYWNNNDNRQSANFAVQISATAASASFDLRIPVEACLRDALGSLPNQNSGAQFRLKLNLNNIAAVFPNTTMTTAPSVRVRAYAEEWDQPEDSTDGQPNQTVPPALNTTQYWSRQDFPVNAGQMNIRLTRVGNLLRNLIFVFRDGSAVRSTQDTNFPDPLTIYYDTRPLDTVSRATWLDRYQERYGYVGNYGASATSAGTTVAADSGGGRDLSVWAYDFTHEFDGSPGRELRDLWLPTLSSTRLEVQGTWGASGTLTVLTNDVTISDNVWL